mmetsp:Transcript_913/g.3396  ORF Transcript_913/g.3396 Transcript_913/m.3396 type:complete len:249 (-) Transcript_913:666-1412(-)
MEALRHHRQHLLEFGGVLAVGVAAVELPGVAARKGHGPGEQRPVEGVVHLGALGAAEPRAFGERVELDAGALLQTLDVKLALALVAQKHRARSEARVQVVGATALRAATRHAEPVALRQLVEPDASQVKRRGTRVTAYELAAIAAHATEVVILLLCHLSARKQTSAAFLLAARNERTERPPVLRHRTIAQAVVTPRRGSRAAQHAFGRELAKLRRRPHLSLRARVRRDANVRGWPRGAQSPQRLARRG